MNLFEYTYDLVKQIPEGKISTYGAVANALGDKIASRAVGRMMNQNPNADTMPCYKIVHSDGRLGGFGLGIDDKIRRLYEAGIYVNNGKIFNFDTVFYNKFKTNYPLRQLRKEQIELSKKIKLKDGFTKLDKVAGIDVSYTKNKFDHALGACVVMDYKTKEIVERKTISWETNFPYISTYLFYREFPIIQELVNILKSQPSVYMFDGNGILHPYGIGLASQAGIKLDMPSIGIAKNLLYGDIKNNNVFIDGQKKGFTFFSSDRVKRPVFVSPGHKISFESTYKIIKHFSKYKIPEPLRQAHLVAKKILKT
ncbi:MAG: endonuclease V [Thermoplasmatales archaeon]|nr:MAG: endonuclease V [Thermoplasmatales archaeon]